METPQIRVGSQLILSPCSDKGKRVLRKDGVKNWTVKAMTNLVQFNDKKGPWLFLDKKNTAVARWIHQHDDKNFRVVGISPLRHKINIFV